MDTYVAIRFAYEAMHLPTQDAKLLSLKYPS